MMCLSQHFCENWEERVGNWPTEKMVLSIIKQSVRVQCGRELKDLDDTPFRMLAIYWHPDLDIVVKIDRVKNTAVTVLTRENFSGNQG
jgi:hypothetical protein